MHARRRRRRLRARVGDAHRVPRPASARDYDEVLHVHAPPAALRPPHAVAPQLPADPGRALPPPPLRAARRLRRGHGPARGLEPLDALHARERLRAGREDDLEVPRARRMRAPRPSARRCSTTPTPTRSRASEALRITLSPRDISEMADAYVRSQAVMMVTRERPAPLRRRAAALSRARCAAWSAAPARRASLRRPVNAPETLERPDLPFTGERFVPGAQGEIWIEHWHRYHFAARWAAGKRVLDVACGEGYGIGAARAHRRARDRRRHLRSRRSTTRARAYAGARQRRVRRARSCTRCRSPTRAFDVVVSFETHRAHRPSRRSSSTRSRAC